MNARVSIDHILKNTPQKEKNKLKEVWGYAKSNLETVFRRSGEDYALHGLELASLVYESSQDPTLIRVALLHDLLCHKNGETLLANAPLSEKEKRMVVFMNQLRGRHIDTNEEDLDRLLDAISEDGSLILLRMAHRLNDVRKLEKFEPRLKRKIAHETLHMYSAIAGRLGMHRWRYEMEDICFKSLRPKMWKDLEEKFERIHPIDQVCLRQCSKFIEKELQKAKIPFQIEKRIKSRYSTYRKMAIKRRKFDELTDRIALRIITENREDCYRVLGTVHSQMHPIAGKLKDYIGAPKENGYQSIHTVIYPLPGVTQQPIEIQIRTAEMHQFCEYGAAAHGEYKNLKYSLKTGPTRVNLIKNFQLLGVKGLAPEQFEQTLRKYFGENQMAVFDADNNLYHIKRPASILDFLCLTQPQQISNLNRARLNGRISPLDAEIRDGDTVEIRFGKENKLHPSWITACRQNENAQKIERLCKAYGKTL